jgi:hypothetical protein
MPRRLPLLNVLLVGVSLVFALVIARELTTSPRPMAPRPQPATTAAAPAAPAATPPPPADGYTIIATRNLFSPTRTEAPPPPPQPPVSAAVNLPKPNLYGVVLRDGAPIAYLEDPVTKRVAGYRVGDTIAGGTVTTIADDTVMLARPEGQVTVRLHDPTRPRPPAPSAPVRSPGAPVSPTGVAPQASPLPSSTSTVQPVPGSRPVRRPLPPSVVRRTPSPQATDAPTPK